MRKFVVRWGGGALPRGGGALPHVTLPETKFSGPEGKRLGQLAVTPEVVASKINNIMKVSKSPGVDGISPKINCRTN